MTYAGQGSVTVVESDTPLGQYALASTTRTTIRRITCAPCLGRLRVSALQCCPQCGKPTRTDDSLDTHVCGSMPKWRHETYHAHGASAISIRAMVKEAGVPDASPIEEARGLRAADNSRPRDIVALDFFAEERHLVIDTVVTSVYRNSILS